MAANLLQLLEVWAVLESWRRRQGFDYPWSFDEFDAWREESGRMWGATAREACEEYLHMNVVRKFFESAFFAWRLPSSRPASLQNFGLDFFESFLFFVDLTLAQMCFP